MKASKAIYFENLDGLRAIAFSMVFLCHFFAYIPLPPQIASNGRFSELMLEGHLGVNLFFVLSGFLITYLLIAEKEQNGSIHIRHFYIRRILRIWPLYFLVVLLSFFIYPLLTHQFSLSDIKEHLPYYVFFISNFDRVFTGFAGTGNDAAGILWSVSVEEQFYLFWPLVILLLNKKYYVPACVAVIFGSLMYRYENSMSYGKYYFHTFSVMSDLAVGALLAYHSFYKTRLFYYIEHCNRKVIVLVYVLMILAIVFLNDWWYLNTFTLVFERFILSLFFVFVIAEQCFAKFSLFKLGKWKFLGKIGIISYGLYSLHIYGFVILQKIHVFIGYSELSMTVFIVEMVFLYALSLAIAYVCYRYFEKRFLKLKEKFITIHTPSPDRVSAS